MEKIDEKDEKNSLELEIEGGEAAGNNAKSQLFSWDLLTLKVFPVIMMVSNHIIEGAALVHPNYTIKPRGVSMGELNVSKIMSRRLEEHLRALYNETGDWRFRSQADRVHLCSTFWQGYFCPSCKKYHHMHSTGCRHRLCAICASKAARVTAAQALEVMEIIHDRYKDKGGVRVYLLTLTQRNVPGEELAAEVDHMLQAWREIVNSRYMRYHVLGAARTVEIVPALAQDGTMHPHIHALLVLHARDIPRGAQAWSEAWRAAMGLDYEPVCDIRPCDDDAGAVYEVSKYVSKLTRVYDGSPHEHDNVRWLAEAICGRRLRTYTGIWRKIRAEINAQEPEQMESDELDEYGLSCDVSGDCPQCGTHMTYSVLTWAGLMYRQGYADDTRPQSIIPASFID